jgi:transposase InsO family protein
MIADVFYLPELKNNLLSIGQLQERKLAILMEHGECKIYHHERGLLMSTQMSANRMFILLAERETQVQAQVSILTCFKTTSESPADLWHRRYGHLHFKGLSTLSRKKMVKGLPHLSESSVVCTVCMIGKQHREIIPRKSMWRATQKLQLIHADICGPITPESNSHKRYILTFTDDYSRKLWTYFLNLKSETLAMFKKFKSLVEKESANVICCLRTDRGGEFTSSDFNEYCSSNGIVRQLTAAYTPQQNGVAERKNRTIMNMVRCMLTEKLVPKIFWPEAVNWAIHLLNRCPTFAVKDKTPEEAWSGFKPSVEYFKVFGCIGHVHIPDKHRQKLDDKSHRCVFLGLSQESKAYRMYDPVSTRIIVSRDVVFEEDKQWNWGTEETGNQILAWGDNA